MLKGLLKAVSRRKFLNKNVLDTELKRCLNLFDLVMFGYGGMIGSGIFVVTGTLTKHIAGPAIVLSFFIAGFASFLSALCYAELGALYPKAGFAYLYTYFITGELVAFRIGWTMLLEWLIATDAVSKAISGSLDSLLNGAIKNFIIEYIGRIDIPLCADYPDFMAVFYILLWSIVIALGAKVSSVFNSIFTLSNICLLLFIVGFGLYLADFKYWTSDGMNSFMPHGFSGVLTASALSFYSYSGFEVISTAAEEAKNPTRDIPLALVISIVSSCILFIAVSGSLSLLVPLDAIDIVAPFPNAFKFHHYILIKKIISLLTMIGISVSLVSMIYTLNRTMYAIAEDGLLFSQLSYVNSKTKTPLVSILVGSILTSLLALLVSFEVLVHLYSIGALLAIIFVSLNLLSLRYSPKENRSQHFNANSILLTSPTQLNKTDDHMSNNETSSNSNHLNYCPIGTLKHPFFSLFCTKTLSQRNVGMMGGIGSVFSNFGVFLIVLNAKDSLVEGVWWVVILMVIFLVSFLGFFLLLFMHQHKTTSDTFQIPFVPFTPVLCIVINIYLVLSLQLYTWIRLGVWLAIGLLIYFAYGIRNSKVGLQKTSANSPMNYAALNNDGTSSAVTKDQS